MQSHCDAFHLIVKMDRIDPAFLTGDFLPFPYGTSIFRFKNQPVLSGNPPDFIINELDRFQVERVEVRLNPPGITGVIGAKYTACPVGDNPTGGIISEKDVVKIVINRQRYPLPSGLR